jgi:hypothetical protein
LVAEYEADGWTIKEIKGGRHHLYSVIAVKEVVDDGTQGNA